MTEKEWVELIAPYAINAQKKFGYLASVLIAQTIQQTGYGQTDPPHIQTDDWISVSFFSVSSDPG